MKRCILESCNKPVGGRSTYCYSHRYKYNKLIFINKKYHQMKSRVAGKCLKPKYYLGKPVLSYKDFKTWSISDKAFNSLFKNWHKYNLNDKLKPSVNRINPSKGYTLDNIEWITLGQNLELGRTTKHKSKQTEAIYELLGVKK